MPKGEKRVSTKGNSKPSKEPEPAKTPLQGCADTLTPEERAHVCQYIERAKKNPPVPRLKVTGNTIAHDHANKFVGAALLGQALGTANDDFINGFIDQLATLASPDGKIDEARLNFIVSIIKDNKPRDQNEAMLAAQMAAVHLAMMSFAGWLARADILPQLDSYQRGCNALARTFVTQLEALRLYRTGGEQKITVTQEASLDPAQPIARSSVERRRQRTVDPRSVPTPSPTPATPLKPRPAGVALNKAEKK
jgi:hypothetical protein